MNSEENLVVEGKPLPAGQPLVAAVFLLREGTCDLFWHSGHVGFAGSCGEVDLANFRMEA